LTDNFIPTSWLTDNHYTATILWSFVYHICCVDICIMVNDYLRQWIDSKVLSRACKLL